MLSSPCCEDLPIQLNRNEDRKQSCRASILSCTNATAFTAMPHSGYRHYIVQRSITRTLISRGSAVWVLRRMKEGGVGGALGLWNTNTDPLGTCWNTLLLESCDQCCWSWTRYNSLTAYSLLRGQYRLFLGMFQRGSIQTYWTWECCYRDKSDSLRQHPWQQRDHGLAYALTTNAYTVLAVKVRSYILLWRSRPI